MFSGASIFNQPLDWDVSNVNSMACKSAYSDKFDPGARACLHTHLRAVVELPLLTLCLYVVSAMFYLASSFDQPVDWDVSMVTDVSGLSAHST